MSRRNQPIPEAKGGRHAHLSKLVKQNGGSLCENAGVAEHRGPESIARWYIVHVHRTQEQHVVGQLTRLAIETYVPLHFALQKGVEFRKYGHNLRWIFARFTLEQAHLVRAAFGVIRLPRPDRLVPIPDAEMDEIRREEGRRAVRAFKKAMRVVA